MSASLEDLPANAIAVVGMAGRFPGANDVSAFWDNLRHGKESITTLSEQELKAAGIGDEVLANPAYVRRAPIVDGFDEFDAEFFGFPPQLARMLDPQHRLFLQCAWHAFEDAGCDPARFDGSIGVYGTSSPSGYLLHNLSSHRAQDAFTGTGLNFEQFNLFLQNDKDFLATRVSHQFDLRGPSITVQTACSSSLVAVHLACQSLLSGECDMALAGGVSLSVPHRVGYWNSPGAMVSAVGHCRPFDVRADGTVFGSGVAIVALKPLQAALDAGDRIHAVIRGSAINNDGSMKMGYAAPNPAAQADVIAEAHAVAGIDSSTVSYVETHGTGTPLGDPIEVQGLRSAFAVSQTPRPGPCVLGSVKSNIGHLEVAAGVVGLVKTILCLKNKAIPGTLHFTSPNPELRLDETPFEVRSTYDAWEWEGARRAGVSSFGVGGTNVHVVLEEAPAAPQRAVPAGPQVLLLSAQTAAALDASRAALADALAAPDGPELADVAHTLTGRRKHHLTMAAVVHDREHAAAVLRATEHDNAFVGESLDGGEDAAKRVVFMFPGQGAQHVGMAKGLYDTEPVFAEHFDACAAGFGDEMGIDLRALIFGDASTDLERIDRSQPALFTVEYALARLADTYGLRAGAYIGYSTGEYIAATLAGVFDLATAIKSVSLRARLMHESPPGAMVAVALGPDDIAEFLSPGVDLAAVNDPGNCVVAGPNDEIRAFTQRLRERGITARRVRATHAFHSAAMDSMAAEFGDFLSGVELRRPNTPLLSNLTGTWMSDEQVTDPATWARQISSTIRFADELDVLLTDPDRILVEVGPGGSLTGSAIRHPKWSSGHRAVRLMRHPIQNVDDRDTFLLGLGQLWAAGARVEWEALTGPTPSLVSLPGYAFARERHWVDPKPIAWLERPAEAPAAPSASTNGAHVDVPANGQSHTEATLRQIWMQCLGLNSIGRHDNFFDLGGDSLISIGIATNAANAGLDVTPQDLYGNPTLAALAAHVDAKYAAGSLAKAPDAASDPAIPPNVAQFLETGVRQAGSWRVPLILRLDAGVGLQDARAVLTALANHHDALRLQLVEQAGTWVQRIAAPGEFERLSSHTLADTGSDSGAQRAAVLDIAAELTAQDDLRAPLTAAYISGPDGAGYLALSLHEVVADTTSREVLVTDLFTAFTQRLAGEQISLPPATASWRDWSLRTAGLATHPAVLDTRDFWLQSSSQATLRPADPDVTGRPDSDDLAKVSSTLTAEQTSEVDDARRALGWSVDEILLAALARTIAETIGTGVVAVDLEGAGRSVLRPDVDLRRTIGRFTTVYPVPLRCATTDDTGATELLTAVRDTLKSVPHYGIGYGLLRHLYAPTARALSAAPTADIHFRYVGMIPEFPPIDAPVQFDSDAAMPVRDTIPGLGHAIEFRVYRHSGALHLDWWYDTRRVQGARAEELARRFPAALRELIGDAITAVPGADMGAQPVELALVDLSALDAS
ncbi:acyltransferase domain-containing protein [Mycobacterium sp. SMC-2]|uniref:type I polyketide synthase n=1 Tax=Mycobacterium sp. SMC-2 TaxID=2857058 RepID=UPI0021B46D7B|nr:beta-ketoacyl synthase N-terminal-like domain-containing protein [Mycobacterium sp. SMC-2]UXA08636.1 acyltransferase domain-containing protein [Mycobacterium sp. SMC-2]